MCNFCSNFGTPLPKIDFGWVSTPKVRSRPAGREFLLYFGRRLASLTLRNSFWGISKQFTQK